MYMFCFFRIVLVLVFTFVALPFSISHSKMSLKFPSVALHLVCFDLFTVFAEFLFLDSQYLSPLSVLSFIFCSLFYLGISSFLLCIMSLQG